MITRVGMAPRASGLTYETCQEHWRNEHAGLAGQLVGLRSYIQNHSVLVDGLPLLPYPGFDACSELSFDDMASMDAAFASEHYRSAVTADEFSLIDKSRWTMLLTHRRVIIDGEVPEDAVKLLSFLPLHPNSTPEGLEEILTGRYAGIVSDAEPLRHHQLVVDTAAHEGRVPPICAAVDQLWFPDVASGLEFVQGEVGHAASYELAGVTFGVERILARPNRVV